MSPPPTPELFSLTGKRVVVTGAAGLLGQVFAGALAEIGAELVLIDRDGDGLERAAASIGASSAALLVGDICEEDWLTRVIGRAAEAGSLDVLVNSAAVDPKMGTGDEPRQGFVDYPLAAFRQSMEVNLVGMFLVTREVCRAMEAQGDRGRGSVINISSTYGLTGPDQRIYGADTKPLDYPTSKAGVLGFTRALAAYYAGTEIRVNALVPGGAFAGQDPAFVKAYSDRTLLGRMARPEEYRGPVAFLASDASSYMTGGVLVVDGGWTAW